MHKQVICKVFWGWGVGVESNFETSVLRDGRAFIYGFIFFPSHSSSVLTLPGTVQGMDSKKINRTYLWPPSAYLHWFSPFGSSTRKQCDIHLWSGDGRCGKGVGVSKRKDALSGEKAECGS